MKILWALLAMVCLVGCAEPVYYRPATVVYYGPGYYHGIYYRPAPIIIERHEYFRHEEYHGGGHRR